jgi:methyl-accepting chemotaxis protein
MRTMTPEEIERSIARLFEGQELLTGKVTELTDDVARLTEDVTNLSSSVAVMREEAVADRQVQREAIGEMRTAVTTMLGIAESMASNVTLLTTAQQATSQGVDRIERRLDELDSNGKNGNDRSE